MPKVVDRTVGADTLVLSVEDRVDEERFDLLALSFPLTSTAPVAWLRVANQRGTCCNMSCPTYCGTSAALSQVFGPSPAQHCSTGQALVIPWRLDCGVAVVALYVAYRALLANALESPPSPDHRVNLCCEPVQGWSTSRLLPDIVQCTATVASVQLSLWEGVRHVVVASISVRRDPRHWTVRSLLRLATQLCKMMKNKCAFSTPAESSDKSFLKAQSQARIAWH